jgi:hypothetical protein
MEHAESAAETARKRLEAVLLKPELQHDGNWMLGSLEAVAQQHCMDPAARPGVISFVRALLSADNPTDRLTAVLMVRGCKLAELKAELQTAAASESGICRLFLLVDGHDLNTGYNYRVQLTAAIDSL